MQYGFSLCALRYSLSRMCKTGLLCCCVVLRRGHSFHRGVNFPLCDYVVHWCFPTVDGSMGSKAWPHKHTFMCPVSQLLSPAITPTHEEWVSPPSTFVSQLRQLLRRIGTFCMTVGIILPFLEGFLLFPHVRISLKHSLLSRHGNCAMAGLELSLPPGSRSLPSEVHLSCVAQNHVAPVSC